MDKVRCPYCGGIMTLAVDSYSDGTVAGAYYECLDCKAGSPYIEDAGDAEDIKEAAHAAAMQRWREPNRVLALEEVLALPEGARVWVEHAKGYGKSHMYAKLTRWNGCDIALVDEDGVCWQIDTHIPETEFGKLYRVWSLPQPPTQEEMDANPWEVQSDG